MSPMLTGGVNRVSIIPPPDNMVDSASIIKIEEFDTVLMTLAFEFFSKQMAKSIGLLNDSLYFSFLQKLEIIHFNWLYLWSFLDMTFTAIYIIVETKEFRKKKCISVLKSCDCNDVEQ